MMEEKLCHEEVISKSADDTSISWKSSLHAMVLDPQKDFISHLVYGVSDRWIDGYMVIDLSLLEGVLVLLACLEV